MFITPNTNLIACDETSGGGVEIAGAVIVKAGFRIVAAAGEESRIRDLCRGDYRSCGIQEGRPAIIIVAVLFDDAARCVGYFEDAAQVIGVEEVSLATTVHCQLIINAVAIDISSDGRIGVVLFFDLLPAGVIITARSGGS